MVTESASSSPESASEDDDDDVGGDDTAKLQEMVMGSNLSPDAISKAKQSKSEKRARKAMQKLGLKNFAGAWVGV